MPAVSPAWRGKTPVVRQAPAPSFTLAAALLLWPLLPVLPAALLVAAGLELSRRGGDRRGPS